MLETKLGLAKQGQDQMVVQSKCGPVFPHILFVFAFSYFHHLLWEANSLEKTLMLGKIEGRIRRGQKMRWLMRWYHQLNGLEFEQAVGDGEGQRSLSSCSQWGHKKSDTIERLNKNKILFVYLLTPSDLILLLKLITTFVPILKKIS